MIGLSEQILGSKKGMKEYTETQQCICRLHHSERQSHFLCPLELFHITDGSASSLVTLKIQKSR